jgi:hypothetical protein
MKRIVLVVVLATVQSLSFIPGSVLAARRKPVSAPKTYQVTGPVLELTGDMIVVQKGKDRWEIGRDAGTKVTGDLKVGSTVTIQYRMTAASIDVKPARSKPSANANAKPKTKKP